MSRIPLKYHTNVLLYTKYTHSTLICGGTDACTDGRTHGRSENIYSIFRDKLLLLGEHVQEKLTRLMISLRNKGRRRFIARWQRRTFPTFASWQYKLIDSSWRINTSENLQDSLSHWRIMLP